MASHGASDEFGREHGLVHEVIVTGRKVGADHDFWAALAHDEELFKRVVELVGQRPTFEVFIDYGRPLTEMIRAGNYDWVDDCITSDHFPVQGKGQKRVKVELFHSKRAVSSDAAIALMAKKGYRPAKIEELLALGAAKPELQRKFPIIALGSQWQSPNGALTPVLFQREMDRRLTLAPFWYDWSDTYRFAAVRIAG